MHRPDAHETSATDTDQGGETGTSYSALMTGLCKIAGRVAMGWFCRIGAAAGLLSFAASCAMTTETSSGERERVPYCVTLHELTGPGIPATGPLDTARIDAHLAAGGDIDDPNIGHSGFGTLLHSAALGGNLPQVRYLLALGANISVPDQNGGTPLIAAVVGCLALSAVS